MSNTSASTDGMGQEAVWRLGPRMLPPPDGASQALRDSIANTAQPDRALVPTPPQSDADWLACVADREKVTFAQVPVVAEQLSVSSEQDEIEGVNVWPCSSRTPQDRPT